VLCSFAPDSDAARISRVDLGSTTIRSSKAFEVGDGLKVPVWHVCRASGRGPPVDNPQGGHIPIGRGNQGGSYDLPLTGRTSRAASKRFPRSRARKLDGLCKPSWAGHFLFAPCGEQPKSNAPRRRGVRRGRRPSQNIVSTFVAEKGPLALVLRRVRGYDESRA
jgi:hypothetical protein